MFDEENLEKIFFVRIKNDVKTFCEGKLKDGKLTSYEDLFQLCIENNQLLPKENPKCLFNSEEKCFYYVNEELIFMKFSLELKKSVKIFEEFQGDDVKFNTFMKLSDGFIYYLSELRDFSRYLGVDLKNKNFIFFKKILKILELEKITCQWVGERDEYYYAYFYERGYYYYCRENSKDENSSEILRIFKHNFCPELIFCFEKVYQLNKENACYDVQEREIFLLSEED